MSLYPTTDETLLSATERKFASHMPGTMRPYSVQAHQQVPMMMGPASHRTAPLAAAVAAPEQTRSPGWGSVVPQALRAMRNRGSAPMMAEAEPAEPAAPNETTSKVTDLADKFVNLFPLWTVLGAASALWKPALWTWFSTSQFTAGLAILMLSMGITLTPKDFVDCAKNPKPLLVGFALCYIMMPLLAMGLGSAFGLSQEFQAGLILVSAINGGQASNLCTYIAKGDVALSVMMTTATTLGAILMTPFLCQLILGAVVPVNAVGIALSTIQVVLGPIAAGMLFNKYAHKTVEKIEPFAPIVGVISTILLVSSSVAQVAEPILGAGLGLQLPVMLLHLVGGIVGFFVPKMLGFDEVSSRTMAIETSMKSSAFGFLLAKLHFGQFLVRVPSAVSVVWMAVCGSSLAVYWSKKPVADAKPADASVAIA